MRVLFVLPDLPRSGAATRTVHLAEQLVAHGDRTAVVTFRRAIDPGLADRLQRSSVEILRLRRLRTLCRLRRVVAGAADTVIHAAMPSAGVVGWIIAKLAGRPMVYSYTNCLHVQRPFREKSLTDRLKALLERFIARKAHALHAVSHAVADQLQLAYPGAAPRILAIPYLTTAPVSVMPNGVFAQSRDAYPRLLSMGRLLPHKRFEDAIRAVVAIRATWPTVVLVIVGTGPEHHRLLRLVDEFGLEETVHLIGPSSSPGKFFSWADLLVHPSVHEGYPRVFAEANAHDLEIVSIDTPYAREYARAGGRVRLARPLDSSSLASRVLEAASCDAAERVRLGEGDDAVSRLRNLYSQVSSARSCGYSASRYRSRSSQRRTRARS